MHVSARGSSLHGSFAQGVIDVTGDEQNDDAE
jgi:hypothetical protein